MLGLGSQRSAIATSRGQVIRLFCCGAEAHASSAGSPVTENFEGWPDSRELHDS